MFKAFFILLIFAFSLAGCKSGFDNLASTENTSVGSEVPTDEPPPQDNDDFEDYPLNICSALDFSAVTWPAGLIHSERKAMALALNITGSFEGSSGWTNIANNFDGQGMSLGLNQQNLGQGSLQPLLTAMLRQHRPLMTNIFSQAQLKSLEDMLEEWANKSLPFQQSATVIESSELFPDVDGLSPLDINFINYKDIEPMAKNNAASVSWAKKNLYTSSGSFITAWKNAFVALSATAPYRSLQVEAAMTMFDRAIAYFDSLNFNEIRALLLMYDFVVQNGGFNSTHLREFRAFDAASPKSTETDRLLKLLEIRLTSVRSEYRADVSARKSAIIYGVGRVHGSNRNLAQEYCFLPNEIITSVIP